MTEMKEMVDKARSGDSNSFDRLVDHYRGSLVEYAMSLIGDEHRAEDAVQEALLVAYEKLDRLLDSEAFLAWLRAIVRHRCLRGIPREAAFDDVAVTVHMPDTGLFDAIGQLPDSEQIVLAMHYEDGLSQAEIGAKLGLSKGVVNMRLHSARKRLRRRLAMNEETPRIGTVESVEGALITLRFDNPPLCLSRLESDRDSLCVVRALTDGLVQAIAARPRSIWTIGQQVTDTGEPFLDALPDEQVVGVGGSTGGSMLRTGIKTIDIFAPLAQSGTTAIFAESGVGVLVLLPELVFRLDKPENRHTFLTFRPRVADEKQWREVNAEITAGSRKLEIYFIPVEDPIRQSFIDGVVGVGSKLVLSRTLAEQSVWPAIDPLRSSSSLPGSEVADKVRGLIRDYYQLQFSPESSRTLNSGELDAVRRGRLALHFLGQPFFVAEPYTGKPGLDASPEVAVETFEVILAGRLDGMNRQAFVMTGDSVKS